MMLSQNILDIVDTIEYIDFHTHMHDKSFDFDHDDVMQSILDKNIAIVTIGTDIAESRRAKDLSDKYTSLGHANIFYTIGVHPHDDMSETFNFENEKDFEKLLSPRCIAIGECGLDYFYLKGDKEKGLIKNIDREVDRQRELFISQIKFAIKHDIPLMIHGRPSEKAETDNPSGMDAYEDILDILEKFYTKETNNLSGDSAESKINGNVHFFVGDINIAQRFMDLGFTFSLGGVITLTRDYDEIIKYIPLECIHVETDSPYVTPKDNEGNKIQNKSLLSLENLKGRSVKNNLSEKEIKDINKKNKYRNSSENIDVIVAKIAEIKNLEVDFVKAQLKKNFLTFMLK